MNETETGGPNRRRAGRPFRSQMEEDLLAVKRLAFGINLIASSDHGMFIESGAANALWQIARQIENHADRSP